MSGQPLFIKEKKKSQNYKKYKINKNTCTAIISYPEPKVELWF
jgi:hypothetical protein